jgi:hypothetical protein
MFLERSTQLVSTHNTTMQVKMFVHHKFDGIEKEINDWMATSKAHICHIAQSQSEKQGKFVFVVSLYYKLM